MLATGVLASLCRLLIQTQSLSIRQDRVPSLWLLRSLASSSLTCCVPYKRASPLMSMLVSFPTGSVPINVT